MNPAGAGRFLLYVVVVIYFFRSTAVTTGAHKVYSSTDFYIEFLILDLEFEEIQKFTLFPKCKNVFGKSSKTQ